MKKLIYISTGLLLLSTLGCSQPDNTGNESDQSVPWSQQLTKTVMTIWKDSFSLTPGKPAKWSYDQGVILKGIEGVWNSTGNGDYFRYIQKCMDHYVEDDGTIRGYKQSDFNIDNVNNGKILLFLYRVTGKEKYKKAADLLRDQLRHHPRTSDGGFWHKKIYPWQMWLDGLYMGEPFYAEYAMLFHEDTSFDDVARQFILMEKHARDPKTGLLYHGWDESRHQKWADKKTALSPNFWGRSLGWYGMALVDALDYFPADNPKRDSLIAILNRFAAAVTKFQDTDGLWFQVVDKPDGKGNYHEASASCMLVYTLAKGVRMGYLPSKYLDNAKRGYEGIIKEFIETDANGQVNLKGTVQVAGLGGNPYRDGSYEYYLSEPVVVNDPKGMGAFILCSVEMEMVPKQIVGKGKIVLLDNYFNNETKKDATGTLINYHYTWDDMMNSGFSMFGNIFNIYGAKTKTLHQAPTKDNLKGTDVYIIVDPDTEKETDRPNYIQPGDVNAIADWVREGGVLVLMGNDSGNAEFDHFNKLASEFGVHFNEDSRNRVIGNNFEMGAFIIKDQNPIFKSPERIYIKELSSLNLSGNAKAVLKDSSVVIMAETKYGKGTVFAIGDPWLYNEYVDGRKLPAEYENYSAATDLVKWLLAKVPSL